MLHPPSPAGRRLLAPLVALALALAALAFAAPATSARAAAVSAAAVTCPAGAVGASAAIDVDDAGFQPIAPRRIADTRVAGAGPQVGANCVLQVELAPAGPPADAVAVALTITSDRAAAVGYVSANGCGSARTETSVLNPDPKLPSPNLVVVPVDTTGRICLYTQYATDLIVDVTGWFVPDGARLREMDPQRVLDTRNGTSGNNLAPGKLRAGQSIRVPIADYYIPGDAVGVAATITVTNAEQDGWVTAWPCGSPQPETSVNNVLAGRDRGVSAYLGLGQSSLCLYTSIATDLIVDVTGCFCPEPDAATLELPNSPLATSTSVRVADSRSGPGAGRLQPFTPRRYDLASIVPPGTTAAALNLTVNGASQAGYVTMYLCDDGPGATSSVNFAAGSTETTLTTIGLGSNADVCVYTSADVHVIIDLYATYGFPGTLRQFVTSPALDRQPAAGQVDHTIRSAAGGSVVTIRVTATSGARVAVNGGTPEPSVTWTGAMQEDGLVPITVTGPGAYSETHWLRCLPHDFPDLEATGQSPTPGWYTAASISAGSFAMILDEYGVPVWYKRTPYPVVGIFPQADGSLAWRQWTQGIGGFPPEQPRMPIEIRDLDGNLVGRINLPSGEVVGWHELLTLPNGNHIVTAYPRRALTAGYPSTCQSGDGSNPGTKTVQSLVDGELIELDPSGNVVWTWNSKDHSVPAETQLPVCFNIGTTASPNWALDLAHINAVDVFPDGDLLVDLRHFNAVMRIDKATRNVEWKLGGTTRADGTSLTITNDTGPFGPHDARVLSDGSITMHDNHVQGATARPRAVEFSIDSAAKTATLTWSFDAPPTNQGSTLGSVRRQPDGSTVIGWGASFLPWLQEVTAAGDIDLEIYVTDGSLFYRAVKVPEARYDRDVLRAKAGGTMAPAAPDP